MSSSTFPLFGPVLPEIGWVPPLRYLLRRNRVLKLLGPLPTGRLLEVGCGSGALLHELAKSAHEAVGIETSAPALQMAKEIARLRGGEQKLVDSPSADWQGHFDLICAFDVLEHIEHDEIALDKWLAWLRPGGRLCISVPAHSARWGAGDVWAGHYRRYERTGLTELLQAKRMQIEHFECYGFPLANLTEVMGNRAYRRLLRQREHAYSPEESSSFSGIERADYLRMFGKIDTMVGRTALRLANIAQAVTARTDLGSGYLVLARIP
jgi:SAM-dependent methyltransferase